MIETDVAPILGLGNDWPDTLYIVQDPRSGKYGCYRYQDIHGLAAFSSEALSAQFARDFDLPGMTTHEVSFDEAREVAKSRPMPVVALMLCDVPHEPLIHFIR
ncbi:MAG: hypothetical protein JNJ45_11560 [Chthonomonas sp.]|nr:hypothetical protein [Chthonomonas sp.]